MWALLVCAGGANRLVTHHCLIGVLYGYHTMFADKWFTLGTRRHTHVTYRTQPTQPKPTLTLTDVDPWTWGREIAANADAFAAGVVRRSERGPTHTAHTQVDQSAGAIVHIAYRSLITTEETPNLGSPE